MNNLCLMRIHIVFDCIIFNILHTQPLVIYYIDGGVLCSGMFLGAGCFNSSCGVMLNSW